MRFQSIEDACKLAKPGYPCAQMDLKPAYRSVAINPGKYKMTILKWNFSGQNKSMYLFDTWLLFGSRRGPSIFHYLSQAVKRCMQRTRDKDLVVYTDDFLIITPMYAKAEQRSSPCFHLPP